MPQPPRGSPLNNNVLIIAGSLVGAAGLILTNLMSKAMNRSLPNVLFGGVGAASATPSGDDDIYAGRVKGTSPEEVATLLEPARRVVIVPGYGMALARAQYAFRDLTNLLESRGTQVQFAIHPVAGRMPGHMNVLLAEADIPYDKLLEMDQINPEFKEIDVVLVMGANDVVNSMARNDDPVHPHIRHAYSGRGPGACGSSGEAEPQPGFRRNPESSVCQRQHPDAVRGREGDGN